MAEDTLEEAFEASEEDTSADDLEDVSDDVFDDVSEVISDEASEEDSSEIWEELSEAAFTAVSEGFSSLLPPPLEQAAVFKKRQRAKITVKSFFIRVNLKKASAFNYFIALVSISSRHIALKSSIDIEPRSPFSPLPRTETVFASTSASPTVSI